MPATAGPKLFAWLLQDLFGQSLGQTRFSWTACCLPECRMVKTSPPRHGLGRTVELNVSAMMSKLTSDLAMTLVTRRP